MAVVCEHCKKQIESKSGLVVMRQWWFLPRPLHKTCWGDLSMSHGGVGSISYQTGVLQGRRQRHIAINSPFYWVIAIIGVLIGLFVLTLDFSQGLQVNGQAQPLGLVEQLLIKLVILFFASIPMIQRLWSKFNYESALPS